MTRLDDIKQALKWGLFFLAVILTIFTMMYTIQNLTRESREFAVRLSELEGRVDVLQEQLDALQEDLANLRALHKDAMDYIEEELNKFRIVQLTVTAYAPFDNVSGQCNDGDPTSTSTGTYPTWGTIAVNPAVFPYGTKFYIPDYGWGTAEDTGGALRATNNLIDVYMDTHEQAITWGRRTLDVLVQIEGD